MRTLLFLSLCLMPLTARAGDWPQWQGPARDNVSKETGLLKDWTTKKPKLLWTFEKTGVGYSSPAIVGDRLYVLGTIDKMEVVFAIDVKTGKKVWSAEIGPMLVNGYGDGARSTPTVDGAHLYALGGQGVLVCLEVAGGKKVWSKDLIKDLDGKMMSGWGYCESPLVDGANVVCCPGAEKGTMAALNKQTGEVVWRSTELKDKASYSSIIPIEFGGLRQYVQLTGEGVVGVAAKDGALLWKETVKGFRVAVIPTPIYHDGCIYYTSSYNLGCGLIKLTSVGGKIEAKKVYEDPKFIENHHGGVVLVDGMVYGYSGNSNSSKNPNSVWGCQDFLTGEKKWGSKSFKEAGAITYADGRLYCYGQDDGQVVLADVNAKGWTDKGTFTIPQTTKQPRKSGHIWARPVVANGKLYLRDEDLLFCYDISDK